MSRSDIENAFKDGLLVKGLLSVKKALMNEELEKIIISSNSVNFYEEFKKLSKTVPVELSDLNSKEQGNLCKKPYSISVIGIKKGVKKDKVIKKAPKPVKKAVKGVKKGKK